jgi:hypothetical protein
LLRLQSAGFFGNLLKRHRHGEEDTISIRRTQSLEVSKQVAVVNDFGRMEGEIIFAPIARVNLQVHWPEGNAIIRRGVVPLGGRGTGLRGARNHAIDPE